MTLLHTSKKNFLIAALPFAEFQRFSSGLELVTLHLGDMLYEPGQQLQYAYFPTTAIVSLHYITLSGAYSEMAGVGNEGVVGVSLFMMGGTTSSSAVVTTAGEAYRVPRKLLMDEFNRAEFVQRMLLRYAQGLMTQMAQTAVCNRHHSVEQQLCRWLLLTLDRMQNNELVITQMLVANMLGVRREGVSDAVRVLQSAGYISCRRGHITVIDRTGLEFRVCECYSVVKTEMNRLLSDD